MMRKRTHRWIFVLLIFALMFLSGCAPRLPEGDNPWRNAVKAYYADPDLYTSLEKRLTEAERYDEKLGARDVIREFVPLKDKEEAEYGLSEAEFYIDHEPSERINLAPADFTEKMVFYRRYAEVENRYFVSNPLAPRSIYFYNVRGVITCNGIKAYEYHVFCDNRYGDVVTDRRDRGLEWNNTLLFYSAKKLRYSDFEDIQVGDTIDDVTAIDPVTPQYMAYQGLQGDVNNSESQYPFRYPHRFYSIHMTEDGYFFIYYVQRSAEERPIVCDFVARTDFNWMLQPPNGINNFPDSWIVCIDDRDKIYK